MVLVILLNELIHLIIPRSLSEVQAHSEHASFHMRLQNASPNPRFSTITSLRRCASNSQRLVKSVCVLSLYMLSASRFGFGHGSSRAVAMATTTRPKVFSFYHLLVDFQKRCFPLSSKWSFSASLSLCPFLSIRGILQTLCPVKLEILSRKSQNSGIRDGPEHSSVVCL